MNRLRICNSVKMYTVYQQAGVENPCYCCDKDILHLKYEEVGNGNKLQKESGWGTGGKLACEKVVKLNGSENYCAARDLSARCHREIV